MASNRIPVILPHANDNSPEPTPPASANSNYALIAMQAIERFAAIVSARPNYKPARTGHSILKKAACDYGCERCSMECAVASERLLWWEGELAKACGTGAIRAIGRA